MNFSSFIFALSLSLPPGYTQMAQGTLNDDFEKELTETELRRLNQKNVNEMNDVDNRMKSVDIHRPNQDHVMSDHSIADPNMFARPFGMMPTSKMPGAMLYPGFPT